MPVSIKRLIDLLTKGSVKLEKKLSALVLLRLFLRLGEFMLLFCKGHFISLDVSV